MVMTPSFIHAIASVIPRNINGTVYQDITDLQFYSKHMALQESMLVMINVTDNLIPNVNKPTFRINTTGSQRRYYVELQFVSSAYINFRLAYDVTPSIIGQQYNLNWFEPVSRPASTQDINYNRYYLIPPPNQQLNPKSRVYMNITYVNSTNCSPILCNSLVKGIPHEIITPTFNQWFPITHQVSWGESRIYHYIKPKNTSIKQKQLRFTMRRWFHGEHPTNNMSIYVMKGRVPVTQLNGPLKFGDGEKLYDGKTHKERTIETISGTKAGIYDINMTVSNEEEEWYVLVRGDYCEPYGTQGILHRCHFFFGVFEQDAPPPGQSSLSNTSSTDKPIWFLIITCLMNIILFF